MNATQLLAGVCLVAGTALAQTTQPTSLLPRGAQDLASKPSPTSTVGWYHFKTATSAMRLPGDKAKKLGPTAQTIHACYFDMDSATGFIPQLNHRRSLDGGMTWEKPMIVHSLSAGEKIGTTGSILLVDGHNVVILFRSDVATPTGGYAIHGYSSSDQGQTWNGPTLLTPAFSGSTPKLQHTGSPSSPEFRAIWTGGKIHIHYEALYTGASVPTNAEECFYSRASLNGGKLVLEKADVPVSNLATPNASDIDNVEISGDGKLIVLLYQDQTTLGNNYNNTFVRISRDGGDNWDKPYAITSFDATSHPTHPSTDGNSDVAVSGAAIVVITEDYRDQGSHGRYDEVYADVSLDAGKTWQKTVQISSTVDNTDTDDNALGCQNGVFVINWYEDLGKGNSDNQSFVVAGSAADIAKGTLTPVNLSALGGAKDHQLCENIAFNNGGQFIVVSGEAVGNTSKGTSEASFISWSSDAGKTWKSSYGSEGERDVDEPWSCVSLNGDVNTIYVEDFPPGGNNGNKTVLTGAKMPMIVDMTASSMGYELHGANASAGQFGLMLISATAPANDYRLLGDGSAFHFTVDPLTDVGLAFPGVFIASVDKSGVAKFSAVPDIKKLIGGAWYGVCLTFDGKSWLEFSDPVKVD